MATQRLDTYATFLHIALVAMAALIGRLAYENQQLKQPPTVAQLEVGEAVEAFEVQTLAGEEQTLRWTGEAAKERLLLVFTTTCPACRENQTAWSSLHERVGETADVVGISLDELTPTRAYRQDHNLPFPVVVPRDRGAFSQSYMISAVPLTLHIGSDGRVKGQWLGGLSEEHLADLESRLSDRSSLS